MNRLFLLFLLFVVCPVLAIGQSRTAERIVSVPFSQLNTGDPPDDSVRYVINGTQGTTPCTGGGAGAFAYRVAGVWQCPQIGPGAGSGDVSGPSSSATGQLPIYVNTSGKALGKFTGTGVIYSTAGVVSALSTSGTGSVILSNSATLSNPALLTPTIASFINAQHTHTAANSGGQLNASNVFSAGTIPPARIISNALTINKCLRLSSGGAIETASDDCGTGGGGGGSPGGTSGTIQFNDSSVLGGILNSAFNSVTGRVTLNQKADGNDTFYGLRFTDTTPTGYWLRLRDALDTVDVFSVAANGQIYNSTTILSKNSTAPSTPASGFTTLWTDGTDKNWKAKDSTGQITISIRATTCSSTDKVSGISSAGVVTCSSDQTVGVGTGILSLNTLVADTQTIDAVNDTNVTAVWSQSSASNHRITLGWTSALAKARQHASTVYNDAANTWSTGAQSFAAATSLLVPASAGAAPTANGSIAYDSTSNTAEYGENGTNRIFANTAGSQTFSTKTLDNTNTANLKDTLFTLQDNGDATKTANFELSAITTGTNRSVAIPNANSTTVIPLTVTASQWVRYIDSTGTQNRAQPAFSDLSGTMTEVQGGTGQTAYVQGDTLYASSTNVLSRLAKSSTATRYLANTGTSNSPAWDQVALATGVSGVLPFANGGTGQTTQTAAFNALDPLTTKGDVVTHDGTNSVRQAVGTNGQVLTVDSTQTNGIKWATVTASAGGSTTQLQRNITGSLGGISGATSDGTAVTFSPANIIIGNASTPPTPVLGALFVDTDDSKLYYAFSGSSWGEVYVGGQSVINLSTTANFTGVLPLSLGGTNQSSWTASRCVQVNSGGTALEAASASCGSSGANTALSNLASVAINTTLLSDTDDTDSLGSASFRWKKLFLSDSLIVGSTADVGLNSPAAGVLEATKGEASTPTAGWWKADAGTCFLAADQTVSSATLANLTGCSISVVSGYKYVGKIHLYIADSVAGEGVKVDFDGGSATATNFRAHALGFDSALAISSQTSSLATDITAATFTGSGFIEATITFEPSASGTFIPRVAQNSHSTGTVTVSRGSYVELKLVSVP